MSKTNPNAAVGQQGPPAHQKHMSDNLNSQLGVIMVQMGHIMKAQVADQDRAEYIVENARNKIDEATKSFHSTLDDMEIEITRAKAVFLRDLDLLRGKQQSTQPLASQTQVAPPAPMMIDLSGLSSTVPVAPMMATGGSPYVAAHGILKTEAKPVAPFPDMGAPIIPPTKPVAIVPFSRVKATPGDQNRQLPKQTKQPTPKQAPKPAPKSNPASARMANKPNPKANAQKQAPKPPVTAPPAAPAVVLAPVAAMSAAPAAPMAPVLAAQPAPSQTMTTVPPFTNATFTLDPINNSSMMQSRGGDSSLDMPMIDMDTFGTGISGGLGDTSNNDTTMDDLDHFFDIEESSNANAGTSDFNDTEYMNNDFDFGNFE